MRIVIHFVTISTHDLTRRSTAYIIGEGLTDAAFQLTTSQGGRRLRCKRIDIEKRFQLTTSQGGRHYGRKFMVRWTHFNSRPHKEVDPAGTDTGRMWLYFNSRPHKEVDIHCCPTASTQTISTHDLTRRSTLNKDVIDLIEKGISTHDLTRRSTAIFTQKVFLSKSLFVLIAYNTFILY